MAKEDDMKVDMADAVKGVTVNIEVTGRRKYLFRLWLGMLNFSRQPMIQNPTRTKSGEVNHEQPHS
jgi:hypothetical protein